MKFRHSTVFFLQLVVVVDGFVSGPTASSFRHGLYFHNSRSIRHLMSSSSSSTPTTSTSTSSGMAAETSDNPLGLTSELAKITNAFEAIGDDKLRYKQLLYMAGQLAKMDPASMIPSNKVVGCLSTVYVDGKVVEVLGEDEKKRRLIEFTGDSDGLLTKGLVALLVRGLSGNTAADIQKVDPSFIKKSGIQSSLTPGRNNGFLNMLATMKRKALELEAAAAAPAESSKPSGEVASTNESSSLSDRPMYDTIVETLQKLKPTVLELKDVSFRHSGHAGMGGKEAVESHFELTIVAEAFDGLNLVKRHQLVYMLLGQVMTKIHALQITAQTPKEAEQRK